MVPTFDPVQPQDELNVEIEEKPEQTKLSKGSDFHFIFLVDRSGSMQMRGRMDIAKEALTLFMRSLPEGCMFSVISFGHYFQSYGFENIRYDDNEKESAIKKI